MENTKCYWFEAEVTPSREGFNYAQSCVTIHRRDSFLTQCRAWYTGWWHLLDFIKEHDQEIVNVEIVGPFSPSSSAFGST